MKNELCLMCFILFLSYAQTYDYSDYDNNIFTFLHISDTHLSQHKTVSRNDQFNVFTTTIIPFISPELVVHSGDITDGWMSAKRAGEIEDEWKLYRNTLEKNHLYNCSYWLDVRGNHDNTYLNSSTNHFYYKYSPCSSEGPIYNKIYHKSFGSYCFIGLDATLTPSPGIMMTYFGYVNSHSQKKLKKYLNEDLQSCNHTFLFHHYPTMYMNSPSLKSIYYNSPPSFILAGHVHTTMGNKANSKLNPTTLELVIRDFKIRSIFRLMVIDNDYLNTMDCSVNQTLTHPLLMVTNPPNSQYLTKAQKLEFQKLTRFIHILVYDIARNNSIDVNGFQVQIDGVLLNSSITPSPTIPQLFFIPWNASTYENGLHTISVTYSNGLTLSSYTHQFLLKPHTLHEITHINNTLSYFTIHKAFSPGENYGAYLLNSSFILILISLSYVISILIVVMLIIARFTLRKEFSSFQQGVEGRFEVATLLFSSPQFKGYPRFFKHLLLIVSDNLIYSYFVISLLWELFGFWAIGRFPSETGIQFLWGVVFIPSVKTGRYSCWLDTYIWHVLFLFGYWLPLLVYYGVTMVPEGVRDGGKSDEVGDGGKSDGVRDGGKNEDSSVKYNTPSMHHAKNALKQCLWFVYFVGGFVVIKMWVLWDSIDHVTLICSPVWCWFAIMNGFLMIREVIYQRSVYQRLNKKEEVNESLIVAS